MPAQEFRPGAIEQEVQNQNVSDTELLENHVTNVNCKITAEATLQENSLIDPISGTSKANVSFSECTKKFAEIVTSTPMK